MGDFHHMFYRIHRYYDCHINFVCYFVIRKGGDGYSLLRDFAIDPYDYGPMLSDVVRDYIQFQTPLKQILEGRIERK